MPPKSWISFPWPISFVSSTSWSDFVMEVNHRQCQGACWHFAVLLALWLVHYCPHMTLSCWVIHYFIDYLMRQGFIISPMTTISLMCGGQTYACTPDFQIFFSISWAAADFQIVGFLSDSLTSLKEMSVRDVFAVSSFSSTVQVTLLALEVTSANCITQSLPEAQLKPPIWPLCPYGFIVIGPL